LKLAAELIFHSAFVEGKLDAPKSLLSEVHRLCFDPDTRVTLSDIRGPDFVGTPLGCFSSGLKQKYSPALFGLSLTHFLRSCFFDLKMPGALPVSVSALVLMAVAIVASAVQGRLRQHAGASLGVSGQSREGRSRRRMDAAACVADDTTSAGAGGAFCYVAVENPDSTHGPRRSEAQSFLGGQLPGIKAEVGCRCVPLVVETKEWVFEQFPAVRHVPLEAPHCCCARRSNRKRRRS